MKIENHDGSTCFMDIFQSEETLNGVKAIWNWNFLVRPNGSVSLYGTVEGFSGHVAIWDSLDKQSTSLVADIVIERLSEMFKGIELLLRQVNVVQRQVAKQKERSDYAGIAIGCGDLSQ